jgi:hypothetical protein
MSNIEALKAHVRHKLNHSSTRDKDLACDILDSLHSNSCHGLLANAPAFTPGVMSDDESANTVTMRLYDLPECRLGWMRAIKALAPSRIRSVYIDSETNGRVYLCVRFYKDSVLKEDRYIEPYAPPSKRKSFPSLPALSELNDDERDAIYGVLGTVYNIARRIPDMKFSYSRTSPTIAVAMGISGGFELRFIKPPRVTLAFANYLTETRGVAKTLCVVRPNEQLSVDMTPSKFPTLVVWTETSSSSTSGGGGGGTTSKNAD